MMIGTVLALAGAAANAAQAVVGFAKSQKANEKLDQQILETKKALTAERTPFLQALSAKTDKYNLASEQVNRATQATLEEQKEAAGVEGVIGGSTGAIRAAAEAGLNISAAKGEEESRIEEMKLKEQKDIEEAGLQGAMAAEELDLKKSVADQEFTHDMFRSGLQGAMAGLGQAGAMYIQESGPYGGGDDGSFKDIFSGLGNGRISKETKARTRYLNNDPFNILNRPQ
jgi:hypothetical protein